MARDGFKESQNAVGESKVTDALPTALAPRPGPTGELADFPPPERWDDWVEYDGRAWPERVARRYMLVPTTCFNCESACGLLAYVDKETLQVQKFEGNPVHPGSRGRNCAKGPATLNQIQDPERILYPLRRAGRRGEGRWERCSWDEALDAIAARIRAAIVEDRKTEVMYHVGRPGEDGYMERVLQAWGIDGHNSHTNICSSAARVGYATWMGIDRPSPDYANARYTLLISSHLESGHYFNPHAQRIIEGTMKGAKLCVIDPRLSNTASMATDWLPAWPGTEGALLLAFANVLIQEGLYDREFLRRWTNWEEYLRAEHPAEPVTFEAFERILRTLYAEYTPAFAERETGIPAATVVRVAREIGAAGSAFCAHVWRAAAAGNLGGWQVARALFFLNVLTGSVGTVGGTAANVWNKWVPAPYMEPPRQKVWNELSWPLEYPLAYHEMSFLLPHFLKEGRGKVAMYFTRVYNPVWTNPDGLSWLEVLTDETKIELHAALTPIWSETALFADYVLPMGLGSERHDTHSYETHAGQWLGFRQPVLRAARERLGETIADTRQVNPGEVWEENEFWIELSWRIDPDGALGIRRFFESPYRPGEKLSVDDYYGWMFAHSVPGLPAAAEKEGLTPLQYMRRYGSFAIPGDVYQPYERPLAPGERAGTEVDPQTGIVWRLPPPAMEASPGATPSGAAQGAQPVAPSGVGQELEAPTRPNMVPRPVQPPRADGATRAGIVVDGVARAGWPTPSGKLEFYSTTLRDWGWPEYALPGYVRSHVHPDLLDRDRGEFCLVPTFRLPVLIHTRSGNAKWLNEIAHSNPLWLHPRDAARLGVKTGDLVRVSTEIGYFVPYVWVTEGLRPGIVACSHHMGRWRLQEGSGGDRWSTGVVDLQRSAPGVWLMRLKEGVHGFPSDDPDSARVWWTDAGVHQNLTFPVHPDPVSGAHSWHQKVRVERAHAGDRYADVCVDTNKAHEVYKEWLARTRPAPGPGGLRRPLWLMRPYKPDPVAYRAPTPGPQAPS